MLNIVSILHLSFCQSVMHIVMYYANEDFAWFCKAS